MVGTRESRSKGAARDDLIALAVVFTLMAFYTAAYAWSAFIQDTARDVFYAQAIRHGAWFPLEGPILGGAIHLGPLWFYILSLPLWIHESWLSVALFAGLIGSFKFALAMACGQRLLDRRFGLLWAICLAFPGWPDFEQLIFFNPNVAAMIVMLALWLWLRGIERPPGAWGLGASGLVLAAALHIHPTTAPVALLTLDTLRRARATGWPRSTLFMALGFAAPFAPYLASQVANGFPDWSGAHRYLDSQVAIHNLLSLPALIRAYFLGGTDTLVASLWPSRAYVGFATGVLLAIPLLWTLAIAFGRPRNDRALGALRLLAAGFLLLGAWAALMRATTPMYFLYAQAPVASGLVALGIWRLWDARAGKSVAIALCVFALVANIVISVRLARSVERGEGLLSSRILDVGNARPQSRYADTWFPAFGHGRLGKWLCAQGEVSVHGHLAYIVDRTVGVDALFACRDMRHVTLMGGSAFPARSRIGLSRAFWSTLGAEPDCWIGSLGIAKPTSVPWPAIGIPIADGRRYLPRQRDTAPLQARTIEFAGDARDALLVTNALLGYEQLDQVQVRVDGRALAPIARNDLSQLYALRPREVRAATWSVSFTASRPELVDVVAFRPRRAAQAAPDCPTGPKPD